MGDVLSHTAHADLISLAERCESLPAFRAAVDDGEDAPQLTKFSSSAGRNCNSPTQSQWPDSRLRLWLADTRGLRARTKPLTKRPSTSRASCCNCLAGRPGNPAHLRPQDTRHLDVRRLEASRLELGDVVGVARGALPRNRSTVPCCGGSTRAPRRAPPRRTPRSARLEHAGRPAQQIAAAQRRQHGCGRHVRRLGLVVQVRRDRIPRPGDAAELPQQALPPPCAARSAAEPYFCFITSLPFSRLFVHRVLMTKFSLNHNR